MDGEEELRRPDEMVIGKQSRKARGRGQREKKRGGMVNG